MKKFLVLLVTGLMVMGFTMTASADDYFEFSTFSGTGYEYDVATYGNTIYYGSGVDVYSVDVAIADLSKKDEPKLLTDGVTINLNYQARTFSNNTKITLTGAPSGLNSGSTGEMYVDSGHIYTIGSENGGLIHSFDKTTGAYTSTVVSGGGDVSGAGWGNASMLSYDGQKWWLGAEGSSSSIGGTIYYSTGGTWTKAFDTTLTSGGSHLDGMEYVNGAIWTADMTSKYLQKYSLAGTLLGQWEYEGGVSYLEGMGFGALGHFWAGDGDKIFELGGGEIQGIIDNTVPEPATMLLFGLGLLGLAGVSRKRNS